MKIFLLTGINGAGKTAIIRRLLRTFRSVVFRNIRYKGWRYLQLGDFRIILAGVYSRKAALGGADRMPKAIFYKKLFHLKEETLDPANENTTHFDGLLLEGQKFAHGKDLEKLVAICKARNWELHVCWVAAPVAGAWARTRERGLSWSPTFSAVEKQLAKIATTFSSFDKGRRTQINNPDRQSVELPTRQLAQYISMRLENGN